MSIRLPFIAIAVFIILGACRSGPPVVPEDMPPQKIIQRAQEASDRNRYRQSLGYYEVLLERYPTNMELKINAEYEIAFIHYKQKKYEQAKSELNTLLELYKGQDAELLPPKYKILTERVLLSIEEQLAKKRGGEPDKS